MPTRSCPRSRSLTAYQPKIPLRIYSAEGVLIGEFGEERRSFIAIAEVPQQLKNAIIAAEDERFYEHPGIDYVGVLRAAWANLVAGGRRQGASTITMQVARNFFLSSEKTLTRKLYEALLAFKIEHSLSKEQILELYVNQIYLGQRAYGFAAASQAYYGKALGQLSLAEISMLAGLPKAPSMNPVSNPQRAKQRQQYVLRRMTELGYIDGTQYEDALAAPLRTRREVTEYSVHAEYAAEMVRQAIAETYPEDVYTRGFRVYTTIRKADQEAAYIALRAGVLEYDRRAGYRGPEGYVELPATPDDDDLEDALADHPDNDDLLAAVVLAYDGKQVQAGLRSGERIALQGAGLQFAARALDPKAAPQRRIRKGAIIRVQRDGKNWQIVQLPEVEAAFIALDPQDGAIRALVGGFDFSRNKFNHVTQAWRQPGSSFKPFIYSASLEKGFTAATVIPDEPVVLEAEQTGSQRWEPKNYDGKFEGPMRLRTALAKSKNMVSIRILDAIGPRYAQEYVTRFGFDPERHPPYLTMALGAGSVTAWQTGARLLGVRERRLPDPAVLHPQDRRRPRQRARARRAAARRRRRPARARSAQRLHHGPHDAGRDALRAPRRAPRGSAAPTWRARPAPPTSSSTPGSRATSPRWSRCPGSASTSPRPSAATRPAAWWRCRSGSATWRKCSARSPRCRAACPTAWSPCRPCSIRRLPARRRRSPSSSTAKRCRRSKCCSRRRRRRSSRRHRPRYPLSRARRPDCWETSSESAPKSSAPLRVSRHAAPSQRK